MRLQTKLVLAFTFFVMTALVTTGYYTRSTIRKEFAEYYSARLKQADVAIRLIYSDLVRDEQTRLANLCEGDPFLEDALIKIAHPYPDPQLRSRLAAWATRQATALDFDTLDVIGRDGIVLASVHYPGRRGEPAPRLVTLSQKADGRELIAPIKRQEQSGGELESLTLLTSCRASEAGEELILLGGRLADDSLAARISSRLGLGDVFVFVLDESLNPIGGEEEAWDRASQLPEWRRFPLGASNDVTPAWLFIAVDNSQEQRTDAKIFRSMLVALFTSILGSLLLGIIMARPVGRPLARLAKQARVVAGGELGGRVDVHASGEVRELVDAFNKMIVDLKESRDRLVQAERIAAWRDIARRIAHEIKNPLFPIQTSIETIRKAYRKQHPDFEEIFDEATTTILEEVERMKRIVTEFSRFARMPKPKPESIEVEEMVSQVVSLYAGQDVEVVALNQPGLPTIRGDREQIIQVLHNLIKNAIDATKDNKHQTPRVEVSVASSVGGITIIVRDNGMGMDAETRAKIFEPYFTTKKEETGTGLGLAIVHRIITDHNGTITVESTPGNGTSFTIYLTADGPTMSRSSLRP